MYTLVASTITQIVQKDDSRGRLFRIASDSTTMTRVASTNEALEMNGGQILTAYESILVYVPPGGELHAISTATPNISVTETTDSGASDEGYTRKPRVISPRN